MIDLTKPLGKKSNRKKKVDKLFGVSGYPITKDVVRNGVKQALYLVPGFGTGLAANDMYHEPSVLNGLGLALSLLGDAGVAAKGASVTGKDISKTVGKVRRSLTNSMGFGNVNEDAIRELFPVENIRNQFRQGLPYARPISQNYNGVRMVDFRPKANKPISLAERIGIPKADRGNLSINELQALEDLEHYKKSGRFRQLFEVFPQKDGVDWGWGTISDNGIPFARYAADNKIPAKGDVIRVGVSSDTGKGALSYNYSNGNTGYGSRSFPIPKGLRYSPGQATAFSDGKGGYKLILTSPKTDIWEFLEELKATGDPLYNELSSLPTTISKDIMKDFWINVRKIQRPGTYMSGDNGRLPLGASLIDAFNKKQLYRANFRERSLADQFVTRPGLSPDSYSSIIRQGTRDNSLRWGEGFVNWNNSAVQNKRIYEAFSKYMKGSISKEEYTKIFNEWSKSIGGRPLQWVDRGGSKLYPVHPHPYIFAYKNGGSIHINPDNRGKFTATMKRTGKTAEELSHSSNPLTRKRAIFALNARKWKH